MGLNALNVLNCVGQSLGNWKAVLTLNFNEFMEKPELAGETTASPDETQASLSNVRVADFSNVKNLKAYDKNGGEITVTSDDIGNVTFASVPDKLTYDYDTGFNDTMMDVEVLAANTELADALSSSGGCGGCNAMSNMEVGLRNILFVVALELILMAKRLRRR